MMEIRNAEDLESALTILGGYSLPKRSTVVMLSFEAEDEFFLKYNLTLVMALDPPENEKTDRIKIIFKGVNCLKLDSFGGGLTQISGLAIEDIRIRGWEKQYWEITDYEDGSIFFTCETVFIESIENVRIYR